MTNFSERFEKMAAADGARVVATRLNPDGSVTLTLDVNVRLDSGVPARVTAALPGATAERAGAPTFSVLSLSAIVFNYQTALSTALACELAYKDPTFVKQIAVHEWGLESCEFYSVGGTQAFVAASADTALVVFRGSSEGADWFTNIQFATTSRPYGKIHRGFFKAYRDVEVQILDRLGQLGKPRVIATGHSLGGALATVFAAEAATLPIVWVHTYGQPRVGKGNSYPSHIAQRYGSTFVRFVNNNDTVPRLPPAFVSYRHVGRLIHFNASGVPGGDPESVAATFSAGDLPLAFSEQEYQENRLNVPMALAAAGAEGVVPGAADHAIAEYVRLVAAQVS